MQKIGSAEVQKRKQSEQDGKALEWYKTDRAKVSMSFHDNKQRARRGSLRSRCTDGLMGKSLEVVSVAKRARRGRLVGDQASRLSSSAASTRSYALCCRYTGLESKVARLWLWAQFAMGLTRRSAASGEDSCSAGIRSPASSTHRTSVCYPPSPRFDGRRTAPAPRSGCSAQSQI